MTQPKYAPIPLEDEVRAGYRLAAPRPWRPGRPADFRPGRRVALDGGGTPGPDQGYALRLARRFRARLVLTPGEHTDDVLTGAVVLAMRRAASVGRAPVAADIEVALLLFGYLADAPAELVAVRKRLFGGAAHDYWDQRALAAAVVDDALRRSPAELRATPRPWQEALVASV